MKLIVGLGNPGREYEKTRHNAGFMAIDFLAKRHLMGEARNKFHAGVLEGVIGNEKVMLMQPMTFMNRSGLAVGEAARFYKLEPDDVLVLVDDTALPAGSIRLKPMGSPGGHNGLADIQRVLGTTKYPRLRIGVGEPRVGEHKIRQKDYVLGSFTDDDMPAIDKALKTSADATETWLSEGIEAAMNKFNASPGNDKPTTESKPEPNELNKTQNSNN